MTTSIDKNHVSSFSSDTMPRDESGDFLTQPFDNEVTRTRQFDKEETRHAVIIREKVYMEDGTYYDVTSTLAKKRTIDVGIVATSAWLTQDRGFNQDRMLRSARAGIDTVFVSPQQNLTKWGKFGKNVCNIIRIAEHMHTRHDRDPDNLWGDGASRAHMILHGLVAKAPYMNKRFFYFDGTAGCLPDGIQPIKDIARLPELINNELGASTALIRIPFSVLKHYPQTVSLNPKKLFQQLKEIPALVSGETGNAARHMPEDTFGHVTNYLGDVLGQGIRWAPILEPYENITVENFVGGGHLSIVSSPCQDNWQTRMLSVRDVIIDEPRLPALGPAALAAAVYDTSADSFQHRPIAA